MAHAAEGIVAAAIGSVAYDRAAESGQMCAELSTITTPGRGCLKAAEGYFRPTKSATDSEAVCGIQMADWLVTRALPARLGRSEARFFSLSMI